MNERRSQTGEATEPAVSCNRPDGGRLTGGVLIDGRPDVREKLEYVVAWEPSVDGLTIRDPRDVAAVRFAPVAAFPTYDEAYAFIRLVRGEYGSGQGWRDAVRRS